MLDKVDFRVKKITRHRNITIKGPTHQEYIVILSVYATVGVGGRKRRKERGRNRYVFKNGTGLVC